MSLRVSLYRWGCRAILRRGISTSAPSKSSKRVWIHAASAGELEILWPVVLKMAQGGRLEFVLSVFSPSGAGRIVKLADELRTLGASVAYSGFSPWEGAWKQSLERLQPDLFVTAKYEAWPELWAALGELGVPLAIVGARARKSLMVCRRVCRALGAKMPRLMFFPATESEIAPLRELFPEAAIECLGEPRWDQVQARRSVGNSRARELVKRYAGLPRPWGILGSAWLEDLELWMDVLKEPVGTIWIVPHRVDAEYVGAIEKTLQEKGFSYSKTSTAGPIGSAAIVLVDEMGFLLELYSSADWAYVGGGFGKGVHSTIEPALGGIPVSAGPGGAQKFPEIEILQKTGQLELVRTAGEVANWVARLAADGPRMREQWLKEAQARLGASSRIESILIKSVLT